MNLPTADNVTEKPDTQQQTVVARHGGQALLRQQHPVPRRATSSTASSTPSKRSTEKVVYLKADEDAPYCAVMTMMDQLREAQIENVGLITETRRNGPGSRRRRRRVMAHHHQHHGADKVITAKCRSRRRT